MSDKVLGWMACIGLQEKKINFYETVHVWKKGWIFCIFSRLLDTLISADLSIEALEALVRVKGEQGRRKVVVTCSNWKCKLNLKMLSKQMTCGALKQFSGDLLCFLTAVLLLHKESVMGKGENYFCSSVIFSFKRIIVLNVKLKTKKIQIFCLITALVSLLNFPVCFDLCEVHPWCS